ncbi:acyltransferase family protein [Parvularcula sp. LCG005]|uniref:acyltransferase family protein n=1 Tax=Parvularcula sp. LCG005 TaxID=3078805 RepID=UPI002942D8B6|nr:acyltransferase family protein [Parvularcula sp. LCG005]WOI53512.1 acyltransferase family protein [Parvularcula sp. LCG005]
MTLPLDTAQPSNSRRYDLDWLRVIAFGLLIFYHVGMFYVTWNWHVKSVHMSSAAQPLMVVINPWRLALLFFISGIAIRFASDKQKITTFTASRSFRLFIPIVVGMFFVVAPQSYFQLRQADIIEPGFGAFYSGYLAEDESYGISTPTWNHLWYVVYLFVYGLLLAPFFPLLRRIANSRALTWFFASNLRVIFLTAIPFVLYTYLLNPLFPTTHNLTEDWANHAHSLTILLLGYMVAKNDGFWRVIGRVWPVTAAAVVILLAYRLWVIDAWKVWMQHSALAPIVGPSWETVETYYAWLSILTLLGLAQRFLNRPSAVLRYLTGAVFCYYILHQTITVSAGYWLTRQGLGVWTEFLLVTGATALGCALGYEILRRIPWVRIGFGIKQR